MIDRIHSVLVVFDNDIREDDAERLLELMGWLKGVVSVVPNVSDIESIMAEERVRTEFADKLWEALS